METKMIGVIKGFAMATAMVGCLAVGVWHGESLGNAKAIMEYELGYDAGARNALYARPVSEELEMVCLGLWIAAQPELKI